jgi:hypothetical protein
MQAKHDFDAEEVATLIDEFLATTSSRTLISSDEVADLLLDLRLHLLVNDEGLDSTSDVV